MLRWLQMLLVLISLQMGEVKAQVFVDYFLLDKGRSIRCGDTISLYSGEYVLETCKFYSGVAGIKGGKKQKPSYKLVDFTDGFLQRRSYPVAKGSDGFVWLFGVDSATQISGGWQGDLDPARGMYWTWQSGFIQLKLECRAVVDSGEIAREIKLHLGGLNPQFHSHFSMLPQPIEVGQVAEIRIDLFDYLTAIERELARANPNRNLVVMQPGDNANKAVELLRASIVKLNNMH